MRTSLREQGFGAFSFGDIANPVANSVLAGVAQPGNIPYVLIKGSTVGVSTIGFDSRLKVLHVESVGTAGTAPTCVVSAQGNGSFNMNVATAAGAANDAGYRWVATVRDTRT